MAEMETDRIHIIIVAQGAGGAGPSKISPIYAFMYLYLCVAASNKRARYNIYIDRVLVR